MSRFTGLAAVCAALILASAVSAQAAGWQMLGERMVDYRSNPVAVTIKGEAAVKAIKLQVKDAALDIAKVVVTTADGQSFDIALDKYLAPGKESNELEIANGPKGISKVEVQYRGGAEGRRFARICVLGTD
jgi:hypothetical protein